MSFDTTLHIIRDARPEAERLEDHTKNIEEIAKQAADVLDYYRFSPIYRGNW